MARPGTVQSMNDSPESPPLPHHPTTGTGTDDASAKMHRSEPADLPSFWFDIAVRVEATDFETAYAIVHATVGLLGSKCIVEPSQD